MHLQISKLVTRLDSGLILKRNDFSTILGSDSWPVTASIKDTISKAEEKIKEAKVKYQEYSRLMSDAF